MKPKSMTIQCQNPRCRWFGTPTFEKCHNTDIDYIRIVCPKCHTLFKYIKHQDVPENCLVVETNAWWERIRATESDLRPAYMIQRDLIKSRTDCAMLQAENKRLKEIVDEVTTILTDAMECEGLIKHVPKWLQEK